MTPKCELDTGRCRGDRALSWIGPREGDLKPDGASLRGPVPPERWPYGPPSAHEDCCRLHAVHNAHRSDGLYCDCAASAADDLNYGIQSWAAFSRTT